MTDDPPYPYPHLYDPDKQEPCQTFFGMHLLNKYPNATVNIVESEKTALTCACYLGGTWLACGGKNNLKDVANAKLYPDKDAYEQWSHKGECVPWFEGWHECGATSDIGDLIEWKIKHNQK
jgi:hypothetical protein